MEASNWVTILQNPELWTNDAAVKDLIEKLSWFNSPGELTEDDVLQLQKGAGELCTHLMKAFLEVSMDTWRREIVRDMIAKLMTPGGAILQDLLSSLQFPSGNLLTPPSSVDTGNPMEVDDPVVNPPVDPDIWQVILDSLALDSPLCDATDSPSPGINQEPRIFTELLVVSPNTLSPVSSPPPPSVPLPSFQTFRSPASPPSLTAAPSDPIPPMMDSIVIGSRPEPIDIPRSMRPADAVVLKIADFKQNEENKESGNEWNPVDPVSLDQMAVDAGEVLESLLSRQAKGEVKKFVKELVLVTRQPNRVAQGKTDTDLTLLLPPKFLLLEKCSVKVKLVDEKGNTPRTKKENGKLGLKVELTKSEIKSIKLDEDSAGRVTVKLDPRIPEKSWGGRKQSSSDARRTVGKWVGRVSGRRRAPTPEPTTSPPSPPVEYCVLDNNLYFQYLFTVTLKAMPKDPIVVEVFSFPMKARSNSSQDGLGWATIIWDNAAGRFKFDPSVARQESLPCDQLRLAINRWLPDTNTPLSAKDYDVLFGLIHQRHNSAVNPKFVGNGTITFAEFRAATNARELEIKIKEATKLKEEKAKISFCSMLFYLRKFILEKNCHTRDYLILREWTAGLISGYMTQAESEEALEHCDPLLENRLGRFLIRFSNKRPDAVTLSWVQPTHRWEGSVEFTRGEIYHQRLSAKKLNCKGLKERIRDSSDYRIHYPSGIDKQMLWSGPNAGVAKLPRVGYIRSILASIAR